MFSKDKRVDGYKKSVGDKLERFEKFLGDKPYLAGGKVRLLKDEMIIMVLIVMQQSNLCFFLKYV
jgi:hypothetical protein